MTRGPGGADTETGVGSVQLGANLLPITKFIGMGLFIKCLGQVDLRDAPLRHRTPCLRVRTSRPSYHFPGVGLAAGMWRTGMNEDRMVEMMEIEW